MLSTLVRAAAVLAGLAAFQGLDVEARRTFTKADLRARQEEAVSRLGAQRRAEASSGGPGTVKNITFTNPRASGESELIHWGGLVLMSGQISMSTARPSHSSTGMLGLAGQVCCQSATKQMSRDRCVGRTHRWRYGLNCSWHPFCTAVLLVLPPWTRR